VLRFSEGDYVRVQFAHAGTGRTLIGGRATSVTSAQCCISPPDSTIEFGAGFQQLVWRVDRKVLTDKLEAIVGRPITGKLDFQSALASGDAGTGSLSSILHCIVAHLAQSVSPSPRLVLEELEQALIVSLLCNAEHNRQYLLAGAAPDVAPRQVRRVEEYIDANWANPFRIEDMAAIAGASSRSVYRTFRNTRGYSPKEFLRQRRLVEARAMLNDPDSPATVTQVALACGFSDASRFSKDFRKAYGQPPSAVRKGTK
jgi:AraC-like DNA-binding protein